MKNILITKSIKDYRINEINYKNSRETSQNEIT